MGRAPRRAAGTRAFGVIFNDVEQSGTTALQFFDTNGVSLGAFAAPPQGGATDFSLLEVFINGGASTIVVRRRRGCSREVKDER